MTTRRVPNGLGWGLAALLPLALCAVRLPLDLWSDEAYTLIFFVSQSVRTIVTDYSVPNNHIFYSLCLRPFYLVSGSNVILRLPSFLFTAGTLGTLFLAVRRREDQLTATLAVAWLGLTQTFLIYTLQVRGYGLSMFLCMALANLAMAEGIGRRYQTGITLLGAAFLYTLPTNLFFFIPLGVAAVVVKTGPQRTWQRRAAVAWPWLAACVLAALFYLPVAGQLVAASGTRVTSPVLAVLGTAGRLLIAAFHDWYLLIPLLALGAARRFRQLRRTATIEQMALPIVVASVLFGPILLLVLFGRAPFLRNLSPALPLLAAGVAWLLAEFFRGASERLARKFGPGKAFQKTASMAVAGYVLLATIALPALSSYPQRLSEYRRTRFAQDGYFNYYAANFHPAAVVDYLRTTIPTGQSYETVFPDADHFCLAYYFSEAGLPLQRTLETDNEAAKTALQPRNGVTDASTALREPSSATPVFYMIAPELVNYEMLGKRFKIDPEVLRRATLLRDFGYYRLYRLMEHGPSSESS